MKTVQYIKSRIWEMKGGIHTKTLAKIQVKGIFRIRDIRRNVLPKLRLCFHQDNFNKINPEKSGNTVKTPRLGFSQLKMKAVFTSKNKGFSRLYEWKFTQSYTTSRDGIINAVASRAARNDRRLPNNLVTLFYRLLPHG